MNSFLTRFKSLNLFDIFSTTLILMTAQKTPHRPIKLSLTQDIRFGKFICNELSLPSEVSVNSKKCWSYFSK
jgi:hypothetical protein